MSRQSLRILSFLWEYFITPIIVLRASKGCAVNLSDREGMCSLDCITNMDAGLFSMNFQGCGNRERPKRKCTTGFAHWIPGLLMKAICGPGFGIRFLHPHETTHSMKEISIVLKKCGMSLVASSINKFGPIHSEAELWEEEVTYRDLVSVIKIFGTPCSAPGSLDTSLSHAAGLIEIAACHA